MKRVKNISGEGFLEMLERMDKEDHGAMSKEDYDQLKDKWMKVYWEIKHQERILYLCLMKIYRRCINY